MAQSEYESSANMSMSQMGESVRYHAHVSQHTLERTKQLLVTIKDRIFFYIMVLLVAVPTTLLANGVGTSMGYSLPLVAKTGCQIGLDKWYIFCLLYTSPSPRDRG